ncbi:sugar ABC transporter ATP-binding protein [Bacillus sp. AFS031507]|uniref:sugar ABC transporter ATP-binding protein n=1 Tax=Bacillus sp. AFS031507 TaxID=2033496 RepID=UPI000BFC9C0A|nr:sugar ABC transporter ATP-binding protein [Bacillus sp. AFS031507]PGY11934.1 sugar ABC transporter ATP-binding protein [Bacillus sp. AFS031507]
MSEYILEMENINKSFNGIQVLHNINLKIKKGEVHALVGGNGAGKSTMMKILTGVYTSDSGTVKVNRQPIKISSTKDSSQHGIRMIFQEMSLIPTMTVAENIFLNQKVKEKGLQIINKKELERRAAELLEAFEIDVDPGTTVNTLGVGYCQLIEIAKALSLEAKILVMDEPTASLTEAETQILFGIVEKLKKKGVTIIYISHRMHEIFQITDTITVMRDGRHVITTETKSLTMESIIHHLLGSTSVEKAFKRIKREKKLTGSNILEVKNLSINDKIKDIEFSLKKGEIIGFAGLMGSGRTEIAEAIFGLNPAKEGEIILDNQKVKIKSVKDGINAGIALIPEDRRRQGLVLIHSVKDNMVLPVISKLRKGFVVDKKRVAEKVNSYIDELSIKTDSMNKVISLLSGGNQQKVVIAKWLETNPKVLIMDEPTAGVDIGAKGEIVNVIRSLADKGLGVILISSELAELMAICDRIIVLKDGRITGELDGEQIHSEAELEHAIQH